MNPNGHGRAHAFARARRADRWRTLLASVPAGILAILFWDQDAIDPLTFPSLLLDRTLQTLTLAAIPAVGFIMFASPRVALRAAIFIAATGSALSLAISITGFLRPPAAWHVVGLAVVALTLSTCLLVRLGSRWSALQSGAAKVTAALLASTVPLLQFWNSTSFLPSRTEVALAQEVSVETVATTDAGFQNEVVVRARNDTDVRVLVIITRMTVCWWKAVAVPLYPDSEIRELDNCTVIRPLGQQSWLSPKFELVYSKAITTPTDSPRMTIVSRIAYARGDRLRTSDEPATDDELGPCLDVSAFRLREESRIKGLAQEDKYLVYADENGDGGINYYFDSGSVDCPGKDRSELEEYFGTTETRGLFEEWLTPLPANSPSN